MLQELDLDFEYVQVDLTKEQHRRPEFMAVNPAGRVPVLVDDDLVLNESVAIVLYLAEKHPQKGFLPTEPRARAEVYRWLFFTATELEQPLWRIARHTHVTRSRSGLPPRSPSRARTSSTWPRLWRSISRRAQCWSAST